MTFRQAQAIKNMVEYGGNMYRAMINAGYSHAMAKNPQKLKGSKGVKTFLSESDFSEKKIVEKIYDSIACIEDKKTLIVYKNILNLL